MRSIIYVYIIIQFLNFLGVFAEKVKGDSSESNSVNWEKLDKTTIMINFILKIKI